jgi:DNA-binding response OmpR family regulator
MRPGKEPDLMSMVLVVSDADRVREEVVGALTRRGLETITTSDSRAVVDICAEEAPELIVCDSQIGSNGLMAVCRAVRSAEAQGDIATVRFLALLDRRPDVFLARRADADAWLVKPYEPAALRWTVDVLLRDDEWDEHDLLAEMRGELQGSEAPAEAGPEEPAEDESPGAE